MKRGRTVHGGARKTGLVRRGRVALALAGALTLAAGCGGDSEPEVAATVEGTEISAVQVNDLFNVFAQTSQGEQSLAGFDDGLRVDPAQVRAQAVSYLIKVAFIEHLAVREGVTIPDKTAAEEELYEGLASIATLQMQGFRGQDLEIAQRLEAITKAIAEKIQPEVSVTKEELQEAYDERKEVVGASFEATTDVAFVAGEQAAQQLYDDLSADKDFQKSVAALGDQVLVAETVDIKPITPIAPDIIEAVKNLETGKTADPIPYDLGGGTVYVVLHQQELKKLPALTLREAEPELRQIVIDHKRFEIFQEWLKKQYLEAQIEVDDYYGTWKPEFQAVV